MNKKARQRIMAAVLVGLFACVITVGVRYMHSHLFGGSATRNAPHATLTFPDGTALSVHIADTDAAREQGLSGTKSLGANEGMMFFFDSVGVYPFWMKDMNYPLDILWLASGTLPESATALADMSHTYTVVGDYENLLPGTYPQAFAPSANADAVVEIPAGRAQQLLGENVVGAKLNYSR